MISLFFYFPLFAQRRRRNPRNGSLASDDSLFRATPIRMFISHGHLYVRERVLSTSWTLLPSSSHPAIPSTSLSSRVASLHRTTINYTRARKTTKAIIAPLCWCVLNDRRGRASAFRPAEASSPGQTSIFHVRRALARPGTNNLDNRPLRVREIFLTC